MNENYSSCILKRIKDDIKKNSYETPDESKLNKIITDLEIKIENYSGDSSIIKQKISELEDFYLEQIKKKTDTFNVSEIKGEKIAALILIIILFIIIIIIFSVSIDEIRKEENYVNTIGKKIINISLKDFINQKNFIN